jgi:hypothetical protein
VIKDNRSALSFVSTSSLTASLLPDPTYSLSTLEPKYCRVPLVFSVSHCLLVKCLDSITALTWTHVFASSNSRDDRTRALKTNTIWTSSLPTGAWLVLDSVTWLDWLGLHNLATWLGLSSGVSRVSCAFDPRWCQLEAFRGATPVRPFPFLSSIQYAWTFAANARIPLMHEVCTENRVRNQSSKQLNVGLKMGLGPDSRVLYSVPGTSSLSKRPFAPFPSSPASIHFSTLPIPLLALVSGGCRHRDDDVHQHWRLFPRTCARH